MCSKTKYSSRFKIVYVSLDDRFAKVSTLLAALQKFKALRLEI